MSTSLPVITHSSTSAFKRCRKLYWFQYVKGLRPNHDAHALRFGTTIHDAIDRYQRGEDSAHIVESLRTCSLGDPFSPRTAAALFWGYVARYAECPVVKKVIHSEQTFSIALTNPETGASSRTFGVAGKLDAIVQTWADETAFKETKTTSDDLDDERYWRRLLMDPQVSLYWIAAESLGHNVQTIVYDVIRKPAMRPLKETPVDSRKYTKDGRLYANQRDADETPEEWEARIFADVSSRPEYYYQRREIPRLQADLDAFRRELWDVGKDIADAERTGRWYRSVHKWNCDNCAYFNPCSGLEIWDGESAPPGFTIVTDIHPELGRTT